MHAASLGFHCTASHQTSQYSIGVVFAIYTQKYNTVKYKGSQELSVYAVKQLNNVVASMLFSLHNQQQFGGVEKVSIWWSERVSVWWSEKVSVW